MITTIHHFLHAVANATSMVDVNIAAGIAMQKLEELELIESRPGADEALSESRVQPSKNL